METVTQAWHRKMAAKTFKTSVQAVLLVAGLLLLVPL